MKTQKWQQGYVNDKQNANRSRKWEGIKGCGVHQAPDKIQ